MYTVVSTKHTQRISFMGILNGLHMSIKRSICMIHGEFIYRTNISIVLRKYYISQRVWIVVFESLTMHPSNVFSRLELSESLWSLNLVQGCSNLILVIPYDWCKILIIVIGNRFFTEIYDSCQVRYLTGWDLYVHRHELKGIHLFQNVTICWHFNSFSIFFLKMWHLVVSTWQ